jgi:hypothetical protein
LEIGLAHAGLFVFTSGGSMVRIGVTWFGEVDRSFADMMKAADKRRFL